MINRRSFITTAAAGALLAARPGFAQTKQLTILSHRVHENVSRGRGSGTTGGDIAGEWAQANGVELNWITADIDPLHDRLQREMSLRSSAIDVAFIINKYATPRISRLLASLNDYRESAPIEDASGIPDKLISGLTIESKTFAIPFRHATTGMHYDLVNLRGAGYEDAPKTIEGVLEAARKVTGKNKEGHDVYGMLMPAGSGPFAILCFFAAFGAQLIDDDLNVKANSPEMVLALSTVRDLYKEGVLPPNVTTLSIDEIITLVQQGRAGFIFDPFARYSTFNDSAAARHAGEVKVVPIPASENINADVVAMTEIWAMGIPGNSENKDLAWDFIRHMSSPDAARRAALNGNGPIRPATYDDPGVQKLLPYWEAEASAIAHATMLPSSYDQAAQVGDLFLEEFQAAVLGFKSPEEAAVAMQERIEAAITR
ncbi:extracellular solute-binding protein [Mesorhizobium sp. 1B3]|uniref:extracellular solute-binding protein n=1 Tax=Mesorhizobium sp. 1B3 TaxID=3243599 RepID=UPI003D971287